MNKNRSPRGGWQAVGLAVVALLGGCEVAARVEDLVRWGVPLSARATRREDIVVRSPDGMHGRPGARVQGWNMNSHGTRGPEFDVPKPGGTWRLVVAGASEMFGLTETPGREFARQLEDSLRAACPVREIEVVNAAVPGMTLPTATQDLSRRLPRFEPDLILYTPTPAQYLADTLPRAAEPSAVIAPLSPWRSRAWPRFTASLRQVIPARVMGWAVERAWQRAERSRPAGWRLADIPADRLAAFEGDLRHLAAVADSMKVPLLLLPHANALAGAPMEHRSAWEAAWRRQVPRAPAAVLVGFDSAASDAARRVAHDAGAWWIDSRPALVPDAGAHFADFAHFTDLGAGRLAGAVRLGMPPIPGC